MATQHPNQKPSLYPQIDLSNPGSCSPFSRNPNRNLSSLYPSIEVDDLAENLFPDEYNRYGGGRGVDSELGSPSAPPEPEPVTVEEVLISIPGAILHLIDRQYSVELACGDFSVLSLRQGGNVVAILARVADEVQWPLVKDEAVVKVDDSHYFFSFGNVKEMGSDSSEEGKKKEKKKDKKVKKENAGSEDLLNYGLSFALKGQENLMKELDKILETYSGFSVQKVKRKEGVLDVAATEFSPEDLKNAGKREAMERKCGAYWTTLAPNVEEYSGTAARLIASGSGQLIKGILWCGDVTADRLKWGSEVMKKRLNSSEKKEVDKKTLKRIKRVKRMTKMTEKVATGLLSGVVKVSGFFTSSVVNSKAGKKFFGLLPGEIILASLDGFNRICDAVEVAGKNVMSTSSNVTTELVTHRYGEDAGNATHQGLDAAGHAIGTAWTVFKIRKALNPKSSLKPTSIAKSAVKAAAAEYKTKKNSK